MDFFENFSGIKIPLIILYENSSGDAKFTLNAADLEGLWNHHRFNLIDSEGIPN